MAEAEPVGRLNPFKAFKKLVLVAVLLVVGLLLALAGFSLIAFSAELLKYSGVLLLTLAVIYYLMY